MAEEQVVEPEVKPTPPVGLTREEFLESQRKLVEGLKDTLRPAPQAALVREEPEIVILEDDDENTRIEKLVERRVRKVEKKLEEFAGYGLDQLGNHSMEVMLDKLPAGRKYEKEIRQAWQNMPADQRANPISVKVAHDWVRSQHVEDEIKEGIEERDRQRIKADQPAPPLDRSRRNLNLKDGTPSPADLGFTEGQIAAVERRGGWDQWARKMGYPSYEEYAKNAEAYKKAGTP